MTVWKVSKTDSVATCPSSSCCCQPEPLSNIPSHLSFEQESLKFDELRPSAELHDPGDRRAPFDDGEHNTNRRPFLEHYLRHQVRPDKVRDRS